MSKTAVPSLLLSIFAAVSLLPSCAGAPPSGPGGPTEEPSPAAAEAPEAADPLVGQAPPLNPEERSRLEGTALVVINMQAGKLPVLDGESVLDGIFRLAAAAREAGSPVFWGYMDEFGIGKGSPGHELAPPLVAAPPDVRVEWSGGDFFNEGGVVPMLDRAGVGAVVIAGMSSDGCVNETVRGALRRGYRVIVPGDAHTIVMYPGSDAAGLRSITSGMNDRWRRLERVLVIPSDQVSFASP